MLRLKKVSCVHNVLKGKDDLPLALSAEFIGTANGTGCFLNITLSPDPNQEAAWLRLEQLIRRAVRDSMKPQDVEEDDPLTACPGCGASAGHMSDCLAYPEAQE